MTNPQQLAPTMGLLHDGFEFLKGSFDGLKGYAVGWLIQDQTHMHKLSPPWEGLGGWSHTNFPMR